MEECENIFVTFGAMSPRLFVLRDYEFRTGHPMLRQHWRRGIDKTNTNRLILSLSSGLQPPWANRGLGAWKRLAPKVSEYRPQSRNVSFVWRAILLLVAPHSIKIKSIALRLEEESFVGAS